MNPTHGARRHAGLRARPVLAAPTGDSLVEDLRYGRIVGLPGGVTRARRAVLETGLALAVAGSPGNWGPYAQGTTPCRTGN
jgi:hypothetical protein